jgi:hypothetical protein
MTLIEWNPVSRVRNAWSGTQTTYGKVGVVLFYPFVWIMIVTSIWTWIDPRSQGMDCIFGGIKGAESQALYAATYRGMAIMTIGFLLYADMGGFHTRNVGFVTIVLVAWAGNGLPSALDLNCTAIVWSIVAGIVWLVVALILVYLDTILGAPSGSGSERTPLTS